MENGILVSVVIPVFNVKPFLREALDSVLHQTYENLEIIIVDDGSTDGSGEICDEYAKKDRRVTVIHQENSGVSSARNAALDRMTGKFVAFLDPDDAYHPDYVEKMLSAMLREQADLVVCQYTEHGTAGKLRFNDTDKRRPSLEAGLYDRNSVLRALADSEMDVTAGNKLYRRELWETIRYPDGHVYEDVEAGIRILGLCKTTLVLGIPLYMKRDHTKGIMRTYTEKNIRDLRLAYAFFDRYIQAHTPEIFPPEQLKRVQRSRHRLLIYMYIQFSGNPGNKGNPYVGELRRELIASIKETGTCGIRNKAAYCLLCINPWLLRTVFNAYHHIHSLQRKLGRKGTSGGSVYEIQCHHSRLQD